MYIPKINFNQYCYPKKEVKTVTMPSFGGVKQEVSKRVLSNGADVAKTLLVSITAFAAAHGLSVARVNNAVKNGELELEGKKINVDGDKTKEYLENIRVHKQTHWSKKKFGELVGISIHSVDWHIEKGNIETNEDGTINPETDLNKHFVENFEKFKTKEILKYTPDKFDKLQRKLGVINLDYCIKYGLLKLDDDGAIDIRDSVNKEFLEKVENKELNVYSFYISTADLARKIKKSILYLKQAEKEGKLIVTKKGYDINDPVNKKFIEEHVKLAEKESVLSETHITQVEAAKRLGVTSGAIRYFINKGYLVIDKLGVDLTNEKNAYFMNNYKKGEIYVNPFDDTKEIIKATEVTDTDKSNYITQVELAKRLGITQPTVKWHIVQGHIIYTKDGIDLDNEQNKHFIENFRRGEVYSMPQKEEKFLKKDKEDNNTKILTNFNHLIMKELSDMIKVCNAVIRYHFMKGRLEKTDDKKFDLTSSLNREFIENHEKHVKDVYSSMSKEQLYNEIKNLKHLLKNRISENVYIVSSDFQDEPKELKKYLKYALGKIVETEDLTREQLKKLNSIFEEIVLEELASENPVPVRYYSSDEKLNLLSYKNLLDELIQRENGLKDDYQKLDENEINVSSVIAEHIEKSGSEYKEEIDTYNKLMSMNLDVLVDAYLYYEYVSARSTYEKLTSFNKQLSTIGLTNVDEGRVNFYVQRVLKDARPFRRGEARDYFAWKRLNKPSNADDVVLDLLEQYRKLILSKICTPDILAKLQEENPGIEIYPQHLEDMVAERLDLE